MLEEICYVGNLSHRFQFFLLDTRRRTDLLPVSEQVLSSEAGFIER